jgi:bacteriorhodopsin
MIPDQDHDRIPTGLDHHNASTPSGWMEALFTLISSRLTLIQLEFRDAARQRSKSIVAKIAAVLCVFFTWALTLAGGIAALATVTPWPWYGIALVAAALHLIVAVILFKAANSPKPQPFPITRSEFQKDHEWIKSLQKTPTSKN